MSRDLESFLRTLACEIGADYQDVRSAAVSVKSQLPKGTDDFVVMKIMRSVSAHSKPRIGPDEMDRLARQMAEAAQ